jgi:predicted nucleotidyltransferase
MRLDRSETIAGQPIRKVRDFLRRLGMWSWSAEGIAEHFAIDLGMAAHLIAELCRRKLLEKAKSHPGGTSISYKRGNAAARFASANLLKPITRERAVEMVKELLARVDVVNADDELVYEVTELRVFGSYIDPKRHNLGDIDLAVKLVPRGGRSQSEAVDLSMARAAASGRQFSNFAQELCYAEHEVIRRLRARKPHLSIHPVDDLKKIGARSLVIFPAPELTDPTRSD